MKALFKTLFGDTRNIVGVATIVVVAAGLTGLGHAGWAAYAMPVTGLAVVGWLARG
jgi:hypothetical protein